MDKTPLTNHFPGINFLVGNNNCGKTTIFKAIDFLLSGKTKDGWISKGKEDEEVSVIITLKGTDIIDLVQSDALKKYQSYVADKRLILRRGSEVLTWEDSKNKNKEINIDENDKLKDKDVEMDEQVGFVRISNLDLSKRDKKYINIIP